MSNVKAKKVTRNLIADYLNIAPTAAEPDYRLMGYGFNTLNETFGAQVDTKTYVNESTASSTTRAYQSQFPYDYDLAVDGEGKYDTAAPEYLQEIGELHKTGSDCETDYVKVKMYKPVVEGSTRYFEARKFVVSIEPTNTNGAGGETMVATGNLNCMGNPVLGYWDSVEQTFTEGEYTETLGTLTVTSEAGTTTGTTKITVTPALEAGHSYVYKTASTVAAPALNDDCSTGYTMWNGSADITAVTGNIIRIVEVDDQYRAKKTGSATVVAKA
ncbi:hypothetical protein [Clostridium beijerinckii]|uniref:hypothetical protein n=1 Tax=Clostridium beijerinckii TaxID=1520 RepID=UPI0013612CB4|nr:hypothetical protein [Clostridium beijerinckii]MZK53654.1 hypothetical protein [Clostridium beijerinckii]MZK61765.1 hypothetical protein [Clostridium beijerinckii]MZK71964.1 hypothetical protein [Clostridium beijerinckii]MZK77351.1 hypothetical protein [Clostridium beijerinckii]MZK86935.1 hypothetical protein [Clostridium beijerinckii]